MSRQHKGSVFHEKHKFIQIKMEWNNEILAVVRLKIMLYRFKSLKHLEYYKTLKNQHIFSFYGTNNKRAAVSRDGK